jgi:multiple sugar transport system substrate-binding protein
MADSLWDGYKGSLGPASQAVLADFVVVQMVAAVCTGQLGPEEAAKEAANRARRYYGK